MTLAPKAEDFGPAEVVLNDVHYVREATLFAAMDRIQELQAERDKAVEEANLLTESVCGIDERACRAERDRDKAAAQTDRAMAQAAEAVEGWRAAEARVEVELDLRKAAYVRIEELTKALRDIANGSGGHSYGNECRVMARKALAGGEKP